MFARSLAKPDRSFFLFGPRGVGKSTWLRDHFPEAPTFDLLRGELFLELSRNPSLLEAKIGNLPAHSWICLDEVQKIPALLDEVHRLMESRRWRFALSGSSARKLKRGGANLLGGRAVTKTLGPLLSAEMGKAFDLPHTLRFGTLPLVVNEPGDAAATLASYFQTYIKEEVREEGLVRKIEPFLRFLEIAGLMNGQQVNGLGVSRDAQVPRASVDGYFSILEDTLLAHWLPAYRPKVKVRERAHPKFYWFDPGVARAAAGLLYDPPDSAWLGWALETLVFHELRSYNAVSGKNRFLGFYRAPAGEEVDFVVETARRTHSRPPRVVCIEVKHSAKWNRSWERSMRSLAKLEGLGVQRMFGVYLGKERYSFDAVEVIPVMEFLERLHSGAVF